MEIRMTLFTFQFCDFIKLGPKGFMVFVMLMRYASLACVDMYMYYHDWNERVRVE